MAHEQRPGIPDPLFGIVYVRSHVSSTELNATGRSARRRGPDHLSRTLIFKQLFLLAKGSRTQARARPLGPPLALRTSKLFNPAEGVNAPSDREPPSLSSTAERVSDRI